MRARGFGDACSEFALRIASSLPIGPAPFFPAAPDPARLPARSGRLSLEIVSHCWRYSHLLRHQLASLADDPPHELDLRVTVFHSAEDADTVALLERFGQRDVPGVAWNWRCIDTPRLLRRSIGRNLAARDTTADWIWFTDCDVIFNAESLDALAAQLQGRRDVLVYPSTERVTPMLPDEALHAGGNGPESGPAVNEMPFYEKPISRATGPVQITHGDVAREWGYCNAVSVYQQPTDRWRKTYDDRSFRWLLGTQGIALPVSGFRRIRHVTKGRYHGNPLATALRSRIRRVRSWWHERRRDTH